MKCPGVNKNNKQNSVFTLTESETTKNNAHLVKHAISAHIHVFQKAIFK